MMARSYDKSGLGLHLRLFVAGSPADMLLHHGQGERTRAFLLKGFELCGQSRQTVNSQGPLRKMAKPLAARPQGDFQGDKKKGLRPVKPANPLIFHGTGGETRTRKGLPPEDFESSASTIPPLRREESFLVKPYFKVNQILEENSSNRRKVSVLARVQVFLG